MITVNYESKVQSNLKYEKITFIGAITQRKVYCLQVLNSNFSGSIFNSFIREILLSLKKRNHSNRQLVLFLDNCSSHRSNDLLSFCSSNGVILLFNLPHHCELNPIEFFWEYIKRPLRNITNYNGYIKKKSRDSPDHLR